MLRSLVKEDEEILEKLYLPYVEQFEFDTSHLLSSAIRTDVKAFGMVKTLAEVVMLLDKDISVITKGRALDELIANAITVSSLHDYDQIHAFVQDEHFAKLLKKHYGFKNTKGEALVLSI